MAADILLCSFYYPPYRGIGARRWAFFSRFLADRGYSVAVVRGPAGNSAEAENKPGTSIYPVEHEAFPRISIPRLPFLTECLRWQKPFRSVLESVIRQQKPRLLVFNGGPFFYFPLAPSLAGKYHLPYWLDFRDAWGLGSHLDLRFSAPFIRRLEKRAVTNARLVTDVTPEMTALRRRHFPDLPPERWQTLENGFEGEAEIQAKQNRAPGPLRLAIWGKFAAYKREHAEMLFATLSATPALASCEIHHFGDENEAALLAKTAARFNLENQLKLHGYLDYEEGLAKVAEMDLAIVNHRSPLMVGSKVYDYIRLNIPMLAFTRPGEALHRLLGPFRHAYPAGDRQETLTVLKKINIVRPDRLDPNLDAGPYSRRTQADKMLSLLEAILKK